MASQSRKRKAAELKVHFRSFEKPKEDDFCLELPKISYDDVTERVASHLGVDDSSKIRLTSSCCDPPEPKSEPIMYKDKIDTSYNQTSAILFYEVLDTPLPELQGLKTLNVSFHHAAKDEVLIRSITLSIHCTVGDLINDLRTKVELSHPNAELRLLGVFDHRIEMVFPLSKKIEGISNGDWTLRAEEIPEEEKKLGPLDFLIHVRHYIEGVSSCPTDQISPTIWFQQHPRSFYEPFLLRINEGDSLTEVKLRVQKKLQVPDDEFSKWKFHSCPSYSRPSKCLQDSDIVSCLFEKSGESICLEHCDSGDSVQRRAGVANQKRLKREQEEQPENEQPEVHLNSVGKIPCSGNTKGPQLMEAVAQAEAFSAAAPTADEMKPSPDYPGAGQLYDKGRNGQGVLDEKFEDVGGFRVLKKHASLYKQIWLKYGHIASGQVLTTSLYSAQVMVVTDLMNSISDMHQRHFHGVTSLMIDWWENKIKMAEQLKFNIRWLRERFEDDKKVLEEKYKLMAKRTKLSKILGAAAEQVSAARKELENAKEELTKAQNKVAALQSKFTPLISKEVKFVTENSGRVLLHGLL